MKEEIHESGVGRSLFGEDMLAFVSGYEGEAASAYRALLYAATHGGRFPADRALLSLAPSDRAALQMLAGHPDVPLHLGAEVLASESTYVAYANSLGRLYIRPAKDARPVDSDSLKFQVLGTFSVPDEASRELRSDIAQAEAAEAAVLARFRAELHRQEELGKLDEVVKLVTDHVRHVEAVCFYVRDRFFAVVERFVNLVSTKEGPGHLSALLGKRLATWTEDDVLIVAGLRALFLSGRSVRFEEFNGAALTATGVMRKLECFWQRYGGGDLAAAPSELFSFAAKVGELASKSVGKPYLRYRTIYALNFQKSEEIVDSPTLDEDSTQHIKEFGSDYFQLTETHADPHVPEQLFFLQLASSCLAIDIANSGGGSDFEGAAKGLFESLLEKIVASAVSATASDYGMSSSLRKIGELLVDGDGELATAIHNLTPASFFTCFVSHNFRGTIDAEEANIIAKSVQKRMMFNRWHFIPGNLERELVLAKRHWYYPPMIPDIALHSDVHRAAHARAQVKFSIRSPGPDIGRQPLLLCNRAYRGFYDVRVVRMDGEPYSVNDMLITRRRTLWLEAVFQALAAYLHSSNSLAYEFVGFEPGHYLDLPASYELPALPRRPAAAQDRTMKSPARDTHNPALNVSL